MGKFNLCGTAIDPPQMVALRLRTALSLENRAGEGGQIREVDRLNNIYHRWQHATHEFIREFGHDLEDAQRMAEQAKAPKVVSYTFFPRSD